MTTITLQEAQTTLDDLIHRLPAGEWVVITENDQPVAQLIVPFVYVRETPPPRPPVTGVPKAGRYAGRLVVPDNFKEPLEEMRESPSGVFNPNWLGYPHPGSCEGLFVVPDDLKEPLEELREYME